MTTPNTRRRRPIFALALALVASSTIVGCATMPTAGGVYIGGQGVIGQEGIGQIAAGPSDNADPGEIVRGFLLAAQAGPNTPLPFFVAREYLEGERRTDWQPYAQVLVLSGTPTIDAPEQVMPDQDQVTVIVGGEMVAIVDERGVFTELATPSEIQKRFELSRVNGQWRIVDLEDVLLIPTQVFNITFRATQLHFPTRDWQHWVIDQRWFAQQTWRTQAVQELLLGPPSWLIGAVDVLLPEGTSLAIPAALTVEPDGSIEVSLSEHIDDASVEARAMFAEQVRATLASGAASPRIVLVDRLGPMVQTDDIEVPSQARTIGAAQVLQHGRFMTLNGRHLENQLWVTGLHDYEPTALAVAPGVERGLMVMRVAGRDEVPEPEGEYPEENGYEENGPEDATPPEAEPEPTDYACAEEENGEECPPPKPVEPEANSRIVRVDDTISTLAQGVDLIAPSIDRFGLIWTGQAAGELFVVSEQGHKSQVIVPWLIDRTISSIAVAPDGARIAVVSTGPDGPVIQVAGIERDEAGVPISLAAPLTVGPGVVAPRQAVWQAESTLAVLSGETGTPIYLVGVGGLAAHPGARSRRLADVGEIAWIAASVGTGTILALDVVGQLHLHQQSPAWTSLEFTVTQVAFPG